MLGNAQGRNEVSTVNASIQHIATVGMCTPCQHVNQTISFHMLCRPVTCMSDDTRSNPMLLQSNFAYILKLNSRQMSNQLLYNSICDTLQLTSITRHLLPKTWIAAHQQLLGQCWLNMKPSAALCHCCCAVEAEAADSAMHCSANTGLSKLPSHYCAASFQH